MKYFYNGNQGFTVSFSEDDREAMARHWPGIGALPGGRGAFVYDAKGELAHVSGALEKYHSNPLIHTDHAQALQAFAAHCQAYGRPKFDRDVQRMRKPNRHRKQRQADMQVCKGAGLPRVRPGQVRDAIALAEQVQEKLLSIALEVESLVKGLKTKLDELEPQAQAA